jgi:L-iditol 2-dehydrogenase
MSQTFRSVNGYTDTLSTKGELMFAARLHGPADLRIETVPQPAAPAAGQALLRVRAVGICGSDLHTYRHARIGDTRLAGPLVPGHEFSGTVEAVGDDAPDGLGQPLRPGTLVAVDPAQPCGGCELCRAGNPNLCENLRFCGLWPDAGALAQWMVVPAETCFPVPREIDAIQAALLEPLGVAIHAVDLGKLRVARSIAILGAGPIGLCLLQVAKASGASPILVTEPLTWRREAARKLGATLALDPGKEDVIEAVRRATGGRGVDVAFEAAWCGETVQQAAEMLVAGGRLILVGIADDDRLALKHSTARRKGLSILLARRMKHAYPRAIRLVQTGQVDLSPLVSHRFPLERAGEAFALNAAYGQGVVKVVIELGAVTK